MRVLNRIPKGAAIRVADALQRLIREVLNESSKLAWDRLIVLQLLGSWVFGGGGLGEQGRFHWSVWLSSRFFGSWTLITY